MALFLVKNVPKWQYLIKQPIKISRIAKNHVIHQKLEPFIYNKNPRVYGGWQKNFLNQNEKFDHHDTEETTTKTLIIVPDPVSITEPVQFLRPPSPPKETKSRYKNKKPLKYNKLMVDSDWKPMESRNIDFKEIPSHRNNFEGTSAFTEKENHIGFKVHGNKMVPIKVMEKIPFRYVPF